MTMPTCPCCEGTTRPTFEKQVLGKYPATYCLCQDCGSLHVIDPHWLDEAYKFNDRNVSDAGRGGRARAVSQVIRCLADTGVVASRGRWLDYGAGDGVLGALLRSQGYLTYLYDAYVEELSIEPEGHFVGCSLVETIEHTVRPRDVFVRLGSLTDVVIATVETHWGQGPEWPYLATDWGQHINFPSTAGLAICAAAGGFKYCRSFVEPNGHLYMHVLSKTESQKAVTILMSSQITTPPEVTLYNHYHAGDVAMSRTIIKRIVAANPSVRFKLECQAPHAYLWKDLDLPIGSPSGEHPEGFSINLHFGCFGDTLKDGLTHRNQVETYNRQAVPLGMSPIEHANEQQFVELPRSDIGIVRSPAVLVENGPVLSGQSVLDIGREVLLGLCNKYPNVTFYHSAPVVSGISNLIDVSSWNLPQIAVLSESCQVLLCRLSAVTVASFTRANHGRRRVVFGAPLGCQIWDELGLVYVSTFEQLCAEIEQGVKR